LLDRTSRRIIIDCDAKANSMKKPHEKTDLSGEPPKDRPGAGEAAKAAQKSKLVQNEHRGGRRVHVVVLPDFMIQEKGEPSDT
jgi:hypothetical protein